MQRIFCCILASFILLPNALAMGGDNWRDFLPFGRRVEADPAKSYRLEEAHGPWMIMASSFAGEGAEKQATELVLELRRKFRQEAYVFQQEYDFSKPVIGLGVDKYNHPRQMKLKNGGRFTEYAVLIGHFDAVDDPRLEKTLNYVKHAQPDTLDIAKRQSSTQRFAGLRQLHRRINGNPEKRSKGPMGNAFVTRNPLLPDEFFNPQGVDSFVLKMNERVEHSLLKNRGKYTVRVARFRGQSTMDPTEADERFTKRGPSKLELAAEQAHRLTEALRKTGVEAYEFHDRYESIVTVGSFPDVGRPGPNGTTEIDPTIYRLMQQYKPEPKALPNGLQALTPKSLEGVPFDIDPWPIEVPRVSIAADYARANR